MKEFVYAAVKEEFDQWKARGLSLNMARGKPSLEQLELSRGLFTALDFDDCMDDGVDARNYGELAGMPSARKYWAELLDIHPDQCFVGGSSSLNMMYDFIAKAWSNGLLHSEKPWSQQPGIKFLCPVPGYDRHFRITQSFGIELIPVKTTQAGPDMDQVERLAADPLVKGIWCVPKYSNPDGNIYSDETIRRFAALKPAAPDFVVVWDNAYCVHEIRGDFVPFPDILAMCAQEGSPDLVVEFASSSKITFPGAGMSVMAASAANIEYLCQLASAQMISGDKVNQLRQVKFLKDKAHTLNLMKKHGELLRVRFDAFLKELDEEIKPLDIARWTNPQGGYFISLYTRPGCARRTVELCREAGLVMTDAGAAYPYGNDPEDSHIRIAPSFPPLEDVELAAKLFCVCLKLAALEKMGG
ncbi:MAG: aminotransferase class I/II-fold pyridoxal phosphate-dependent enzyme [Lawsonibacter sp.]|jgi:DNA-binding transcriptional MocR family regulator|nr:aminotransferase class I/II-fold pyridoxal phosphate-dependent enzyme [Lawsonibacter sp.]